LREKDDLDMLRSNEEYPFMFRVDLEAGRWGKLD